MYIYEEKEELTVGKSYKCPVRLKATEDNSDIDDR